MRIIKICAQVTVWISDTGSGWEPGCETTCDGMGKWGRWLTKGWHINDKMKAMVMGADDCWLISEQQMIGDVFRWQQIDKEAAGHEQWV